MPPTEDREANRQAGCGIAITAALLGLVAAATPAILIGCGTGSTPTPAPTITTTVVPYGDYPRTEPQP